MDVERRVRMVLLRTSRRIASIIWFVRSGVSVGIGVDFGRWGRSVGGRFVSNV